MRVGITGSLAATVAVACAAASVGLRPHALTPVESRARGCWSMPVTFVSQGDSSITIVLDSALYRDSMEVSDTVPAQPGKRYAAALLMRPPLALRSRYPIGLWFAWPGSDTVTLYFRASIGGFRLDGPIQGDSLPVTATYWSDERRWRYGSGVLHRAPC